MPRNARVVLPGRPYHVTQRGNNRQDVFFSTQDREVYLDLIRSNLADAGVRVHAYCLMSNHVHWIVVPERGDSLAVLFRRVHGRYAQYLNVRRKSSGHLWQARFFSCVLSGRHLELAARYVERNPVRASMVESAEQYAWSSASHHVADRPQADWLDLSWWRQLGGAAAWKQKLAEPEPVALTNLIRRCTHAERPFGDEAFLTEIEQQTGRNWRRFQYDAELKTAEISLSLERLSHHVDLSPKGTERSVPARSGTECT